MPQKSAIETNQNTYKIQQKSIIIGCSGYLIYVYDRYFFKKEKHMCRSLQLVTAVQNAIKNIRNLFCKLSKLNSTTKCEVWIESAKQTHIYVLCTIF